MRLGAEIIGYAMSFGQSLVTPKAALAVRLLAAESQLAVCTQRIEDKKAPRPRFSASFRVLWVVLSKLMAGWERWVPCLDTIRKYMVKGRPPRVKSTTWLPFLQGRHEKR